MAVPLTVLIVEDDKNDAELISNELHRAGFSLNATRVDTLPAMKAALERQPWQAVISDYSLGSFDGTKTLALFKEYELDIPFICVSGAMGEELAVNMMKAGAQDYVLKNNLSRLGLTMKRELRAAEARRKSRDAEHMAAHLAAIVDGSNDAITGKNLGGTVLSWNRAAERIYGYTAQEMIGSSISIIIPPDRQLELAELLKKVGKGQRIDAMETVRRRKDGRLVDVLLTISPIRNPQNKVIGVSTITRDITERKRQEAERVKLIEELKDALSHVKTLSGLLPICAWCKKIRDDGGYWQQVETYIVQHTQVDFTHAICPDCLTKVHPGKTPFRQNPSAKR